MAIRYLKPETPPVPGEIIITQEPNITHPPAPPLIIRQQPTRPLTPDPLIIREAPPTPPAPVGRQLISIGGKRIPAPPRKVVIERLAKLPAKPQSVLIERWLPYDEVKRKVIFERAPADPVVPNPSNVIVEWDAPNVNIKREFRYLGVIKADPNEYTKYFGATLKQPKDLPEFVREIKNPDGVILAADYQPPKKPELEGDLHALDFIDLSKEEDLSSYEMCDSNPPTCVGVLCEKTMSMSTEIKLEIAAAQVIQASHSFANCETSTAVISAFNSASVVALNEIINQIFEKIDLNNTGAISVEDAKQVYLRLSKRLYRNYNAEDIERFFNGLNVNNNALDLEEFKKIFLKLSF